LVVPVVPAQEVLQLPELQPARPEPLVKVMRVVAEQVMVVQIMLVAEVEAPGQLVVAHLQGQLAAQAAPVLQVALQAHQ
jgi:hypothetical protein